MAWSLKAGKPASVAVTLNLKNKIPKYIILKQIRFKNTFTTIK